MGKRRKSRELALQALYQVDFHGADASEQLQRFWEEQRLSEELLQFVRDLVEGVIARREDLDRLIDGHSDHWRIHRMSRVDRNVLRIAVYEFLAHPDIPVKVTIDEAIEIGKKFGSSESGAFINGILDHIRKTLNR